MEKSFEHKPVLLHEVLTYLNPQPKDVMIDCTLGGGGHSKAILTRIIPGGRLIALDQDTQAIAAARENLKPLGEKNFAIFHSNFLHLKDVLQEAALDKVDGVLYDLGVSSYQLDEAARGFSYQQDAPLDMRMDRSISLTAADLVNKMSAAELSKIIFDYGEERWAKRIAEFIVREREQQPVTTTGQLVDVIKKAIPKGARKEGPHPAKRTFQALRIAVNKELEILAQSIENGIDVLKPQGRLAVITFHSLEDRIVKKTFQKMAEGCVCPKDLPACVCKHHPAVRIVTGKPILPGEEELLDNPRSRSAKLRVVEKIAGF